MTTDTRTFTAEELEQAAKRLEDSNNEQALRLEQFVPMLTFAAQVVRERDSLQRQLQWLTDAIPDTPLTALDALGRPTDV